LQSNKRKEERGRMWSNDQLSSRKGRQGKERKAAAMIDHPIICCKVTKEKRRGAGCS